ncbi:hypothetical protein DBIPINDM_004856 [Mesorhizobium sp. AR02]|uniref:hypothetical protein n=1 Tax=Mesorhizobium sp. AR02 TaxID=2865837 RepID=UPI00216064BB|nr:hypothetical protein [Mesorhizobium sp. AR02]UVK51570.1 hypothetical protein DBIPINDM_004856 [Mesorhizobium sp. AR02]
MRIIVDAAVAGQDRTNRHRATALASVNVTTEGGYSVIIRKSDGGPININTANWKYIVRAWA